MLRLLALAAACVAVLGACPNQCSGHGWCDENERCQCFRAPGTANQHLAYVGADCSQRVCPYGTTHDLILDATQELAKIWDSETNPYVGYIPADPTSNTPLLKAFLNQGTLFNRDIGLDVRVVAVDYSGPSNTIRFQWKTSDLKTYSAEVVAVYSSGSSDSGAYTTRQQAYQITSASGPTGLYIYFDITSATLVPTIKAGDRYFMNVTFNDGVRFIADDANTAHQPFECSGRGICDRSTGSCNCVAGYSGDACQRTVCPGDCSGNGICQSEAYFVQDASTASGLSLTYTGFDANSAYGCKCDAGFRGPDCASRECPSGPDPMNGDGGAQGMDCSGRGLCDYSTGICKCFKGFFGERCEEQTNLI